MFTNKKFKIWDNTLFLLTSSIFLQSFSFLSIKYSTMQTGLYLIILLGLSFFFLAMRALVWQILLKSVELSKIYPLASLVQVLILIYSAVLFNENVTITNVIGLIIMLTGIYYMSSKNVT